MNSYILQIIGGALLAVFADTFSPTGWKKYISPICGIILVTIIVSPIASHGGIDFVSPFSEADASYKAYGEEIYSDMLKEEFSKKLALDIQERIMSEFSAETSVETQITMNGKGGVEKIEKIIIRGIEPNKAVTDRISYIYNVDEVITIAG